MRTRGAVICARDFGHRQWGRRGNRFVIWTLSESSRHERQVPIQRVQRRSSVSERDFSFPCSSRPDLRGVNCASGTSAVWVSEVGSTVDDWPPRVTSACPNSWRPVLTTSNKHASIDLTRGRCSEDRSHVGPRPASPDRYRSGCVPGGSRSSVATSRRTTQGSTLKMRVCIG